MMRYIDAEHARDLIEVDYWRARGIPVNVVPSWRGFWASHRWAFIWGFRRGYPMNRRRDAIKMRPYLIRLRSADDPW